MVNKVVASQADITKPKKVLSIDEIVKLATQIPEYPTKPTNAGDIAGSVGAGDWGGALANALKYLNTAEGKTILSGTTPDPYEKQAWLGQAGEQKGLESAQTQAYNDALKGTREGAFKIAAEGPLMQWKMDTEASARLKDAGMTGQDFADAWTLYKKGIPIDEILSTGTEGTNIIEQKFLGRGKSKIKDNGGFIDVPTTQEVKPGR